MAMLNNQRVSLAMGFLSSSFRKGFTAAFWYLHAMVDPGLDIPQKQQQRQPQQPQQPQQQHLHPRKPKKHVLFKKNNKSLTIQRFFNA